ncbi:Hypothetical Protein FCC1311_090672 [Hondaea fermentalgiana]|uniref:Uncharacterized protein n=1 Tax=Hondaea fermentalgiana TaxID=2315210 RepID=A0A2R5GPP1_9STRA|nr:Hypothetical Protein FCC1311_090672 [Hondaea fermentalgiana]|eukprot:GBG32842.1 Hypothetical Protein FCC1311_090672 [Hondaea fermentalgiana]
MVPDNGNTPLVYAQPVKAPVNPQPALYTYASLANANANNGYIPPAYVAQPVQQSGPVAPVYVAYGASAPNTDFGMERAYYEAELERQRRLNAEMHTYNVERQMGYEQRRRQQDTEEACCCLALGALCCAAVLATN